MSKAEISGIEFDAAETLELLERAMAETKKHAAEDGYRHTFVDEDQRSVSVDAADGLRAYVSNKEGETTRWMDIENAIEQCEIGVHFMDALEDLVREANDYVVEDVVGLGGWDGEDRGVVITSSPQHSGIPDAIYDSDRFVLSYVSSFDHITKNYNEVDEEDYPNDDYIAYFIVEAVDF